VIEGLRRLNLLICFAVCCNCVVVVVVSVLVVVIVGILGLREVGVALVERPSAHDMLATTLVAL